MAPQIDASLIQFYSGYSQDPATIVYYAQMALYYQQQGYQGGQGGPAPPGGAAPPGGPPPPQGPDQAAAAAAQQYQTMNAYGTPTQGQYGQQQPAGYASNAGPGSYGSPYNPQQQQAPQHSPPPPRQDYDDRSRQGRGSYANMPPPPGL